MTEKPSAYPKEASCPVCGVVRRVTKDGRMVAHTRHTSMYRHCVHCDGSGVAYNDAYLHSRFDAMRLARRDEERIANAMEDLAKARKTIERIEAELPPLQRAADESKAALSAWDAENTKETR